MSIYIDYVINREDTKGMVESGSIKYQMVPLCEEQPAAAALAGLSARGPLHFSTSVR